MTAAASSSSTSSPPSPSTPAARRPRVAVLVAILLCSYAIALETTVVTAAIPTVIQGFGGLSDLSWVFSAYLIAQVVTMPVFGSASDRRGRVKVYVLAAALFFAGTLACGLAQDMTSLVLFRALQGVGAGGLITVGTAALNDIIPHELRGRYQAMGNAVWGIAAISGPVVGSLIMELLDWRFIFWVNLPIVVASTVLLCLFYRGRPVTEGEQKLAILPSLGMCAALLSVMVALVHNGGLTPLQWGLCVAGAVLGALLMWVCQRGGGAGVFPKGLMRTRMVPLASASSFLCGAIAMGMTVYVPSFAATVLRADTLVLSMTVAVMTFTWTVSGIAVGTLMKTRHYRGLAIAASGGLVAGAIGLCGAVAWSQAALPVLVVSGLLGIGLGGCSVVFSVALQSMVADSLRGSATSAFYLSRMLGQSIGVALCGGLLADSQTLAVDALRSQFLIMFSLLAGVAGLQLMLALRTPGTDQLVAPPLEPTPQPPAPSPSSSKRFA